MPVFTSLPNGPVTNGIASTAASTAEEPVSEENSLEQRLVTHGDTNTLADNQVQHQNSTDASAVLSPDEMNTPSEDIVKEEEEGIDCDESSNKTDLGKEEGFNIAISNAEPDSTVAHEEAVEEGKGNVEVQKAEEGSSKEGENNH